MIVAVAGGKGGVGKTTVSLNLGNELGAVIVDGDLATTDLPTPHGPGIHDVLVGRVDPREAVGRVGSVRLLSAGHAVEGARASDLQRFRKTITAIERAYGSVVIDCPAGLAQDIGMFLDTADLVVLVTTPETAARTDAARTRELAVQLGTPISTIVVNKVDKDAASERLDSLRTEIEAELGAECIPVPFDSTVAAAQEDGKPIVDVEPEALAVDQFESIAARIKSSERRIA